MKTVELLAPAKDYASAVAAVDYGADAVYIGGVKFGARHAAGNSAEQIARVVEYAHQYGVRVHATLNTLIFDEELEAAERQARELIAAGIDALIVQDMALRRMGLPVELHASTQMCNRTPEQARFLGDAGFARVILERALSIDEIRAVCAATKADVECFVHGAICVGYSGRCFLSRSMSARSGNRGACSQPCRLTYDLTDGRGRKFVAGKHLLSLRDLNLSARLGQLMDAGVTSFKIEGRLKDVNYIRNVVACYRRAVDRALAGRPHLRRPSFGVSIPDFTPDTAKSFTRGETEYFFAGRRAGVASFDTPKSVGEYVGRVAQTAAGWFRLEGAHTLAPGDGICFVVRGELKGTHVNAVEGACIAPNRMEGIVPGTDAYRNFDLRFNQFLERSRTRRVVPLRAKVCVTESRVTALFEDERGGRFEFRTEGAFHPAQHEAKMEATLREQLQKAGGTIFRVDEVRIEWPQGVRFVPSSVLAALRREALEAIREAYVSMPRDHAIRPENPDAAYPSTRLTAEENVTNCLAEAFYRDHGVTEIEPGLDLSPTMAGRCVMRSAYCIRREIGECLRERHGIVGDLYLERGTLRYKLEFDCARCEMRLVDVSNPKTINYDRYD